MRWDGKKRYAPLTRDVSCTVSDISEPKDVEGWEKGKGGLMPPFPL